MPGKPKQTSGRCKAADADPPVAGRGRPPTSYDVAHLAGVSQSTVLLAFAAEVFFFFLFRK